MIFMCYVCRWSKTTKKNKAMKRNKTRKRSKIMQKSKGRNNLVSDRYTFSACNYLRSCKLFICVEDCIGRIGYAIYMSKLDLLKGTCGYHLLQELRTYLLL